MSSIAGTSLYVTLHHVAGVTPRAIAAACGAADVGAALRLVTVGAEGLLGQAVTANEEAVF